MSEIKKQGGEIFFNHINNPEKINDGIDEGMEILKNNLEAIIGDEVILNKVLNVVGDLTISFPELDLCDKDYNRFILIINEIGNDVLTESSEESLFILIGGLLGIDTEVLINKKAA